MLVVVRVVPVGAPAGPGGRWQGARLGGRPAVCQLDTVTRLDTRRSVDDDLLAPRTVAISTASCDFCHLRPAAIGSHRPPACFVCPRLRALCRWRRASEPSVQRPASSVQRPAPPKASTVAAVDDPQLSALRTESSFPPKALGQWSSSSLHLRRRMKVAWLAARVAAVQATTWQERRSDFVSVKNHVHLRVQGTITNVTDWNVFDDIAHRKAVRSMLEDMSCTSSRAPTLQ
jgi:hypothetical protein